MDPYRRLLDEAKAKRNEAVNRARTEYKQSVQRIKELEVRLGTKRTVVEPKRRILIDLISDAYPRDRMFTIGEVVENVKRSNQDRIFFEPSIRGVFHKLIRRGDIKRIMRDDAGYVLYAEAGFKSPASEFGMMKTSDVAAKLLRERGPTRASELAVLMRERGYKPHCDPQQLLNAVKCALQRHPQRFKESGGKWSVIGS